MPHVHRDSRLYSFADARPIGEGWETVTIEEFNALRAGGWEPIEYQPIPSEVTRRQLFLELNALGITRAAIRGMLAGNEAALIEFEEATTFARTHPLVESLGAQLQFMAWDVDDIFRRASAR